MSMVIALKTADGIVLGADSYSALNYKDGAHFDYHTGTKLYAFDNLAIGVTGVSGIHVYRSFLSKYEIVELPDFVNSMMPHCEDSVSKFVFEFIRAWNTYDCYLTKTSEYLVCGLEHGEPCMAVLLFEPDNMVPASCTYVTGNYCGSSWVGIPDSFELDQLNNIDKNAGIDIVRQMITLTAVAHSKRVSKKISLPVCIYFISNDGKGSGWVESYGREVKPSVVDTFVSVSSAWKDISKIAKIQH